MNATPDTRSESSARQTPSDANPPGAEPPLGAPVASTEGGAPRPGTLTETLMALARHYGPVYQLPNGAPRTLVLSGPALVDEVCDDQRFDKKIRGGLGEMRGLLGDGLFTADTANPNWSKAHRILLPVFSIQAMKDYMPQMLDLAGQLVLKWQRLNPDDEIDVPADMTRLTLDTIGLCGFGYRFNSFYREQPHPFVHAMVDSLERAQRRGYGSGGADAAAEAMQEQRDYETMNALVDHVIQQRRAGGQEAIAAHHDLLSAMLSGLDRRTGERLDDTNIRYQILTFMIAGHETTSGALSFTLYALLKHPEILARAYDEVDRVLGGDLSIQPSYEQVRQLTYITQTFKEALRLWPTAPGFSRCSYEPTRLGGTYAITPEDGLFVMTPMLHRDPSLWGENADAFSPDQFSPEAEKARPANAYKPFGTGQRACIGRQFAMQEAALALGMILQRFELLDHTNYQLHIKQTLTIKPDGFHITVRPRAGRTTAPITTPASHGNGHQPIESVTISRPAPALAANQHNTPLLVLFGSNLGTAENLAHRIADDGTARGFASAVASLDDFSGKLPASGALVLVTASYNGTPPDNAVRFCSWLQAATTPKDACRGVRYAVFGCGDSDWTATFQAIPRLIDGQLATHGAQRFYRRGEGDARGDFDGQFQSWYGALWPAMTKALGLDVAVAAETTAGPLYTLELVTAPEANPYATTFGARPLPVLVNRELHSLDGGHSPERSCRHIEVALAEGMSYRTGDHLAVIPHNPVPLVERALARFGIARDAFFRIHRASSGTSQLPLDTPIPVLGLLARWVELQDVATRGQIKRLAEYDDCPPEKQELLALAEDPRYTNDVLTKRISLLDLLDEFPACALPFNVFLEWVHPLRPRFYSIASAPVVDARRCAITVSVVEAPARCGKGIFQGAASTYLQAQPVSSVVYAYVRGPQMPFAPPQDTSLPIVMIGPGTGFAPFRGFLQERASQKASGNSVGPALLFYGCRNDEDFIYKDELLRWVDEGVTTAYTAYSRLTGQPKQYVQDQIKAHADEVWDLVQQGAIVYVCGDASRMEPDVRRAIAGIYQTMTGADAEAADEWMTQLQKDGRYLADVWAGG